MPVEHLTIEDPKELMEIVSKELEGIEKGLKVIGNEIPVDEKTRIEMLCHDEDGQLVIVQPALKEDKEMIIQALKCVDYVDKFKMMLAATNPKSKIDSSKPPRVVLLLPECSEEIVRLVKHIKDVRIDLYTWEYLKIEDYKGLHIEPILISSLERKKEEKPKEKPKKELEKSVKKKEEKKEEKSKPEPKPEPKPKEMKEEAKQEPKPEPKHEPKEPPKLEPVFEPPPMKPKEEKKESKRKLKLF